MGLFVIGPLWLAFGLLVGTKFGRVISLIIGAMMVVSMVNGPAPDQRPEAMRAGSFDCMAALQDDTKFKDDVWAYCSGVYGGEAQWTAMVQAQDRPAMGRSGEKGGRRQGRLRGEGSGIDRVGPAGGETSVALNRSAGPTTSCG
jgi:hypothetical protein